MLGAMLPGDVTPDRPAIPIVSSLDEVAFYVPPYMGPTSSLEIMREMPALQVVQLLTAGFDSVLPHLPPGVTLCNAAGVHDASTAELAVGLLIASLRGLDEFARAMPTGAWLAGRRPALADRRVIVVGAGGVGRAIQARLEPFEVDVVLVGREARQGVQGVDALPRLVADADAVVLAVPLSAETRHLVDAELLSRMPDGCVVVNVARGPVVDTEALADEVIDGRLKAALDVTDPEPLPADHRLWRATGALISPHVGGNTTAFLPRARRLVEEQLVRFADGRELRAVVSRPRAR
ncbi:MAG: hypothetical protein K9G24_03445 [Candidatus Nanopelagicales bacterium]|nr:hypothetical protein [Candidatus Nanopelagicales bacterium]MCF8537443.1 hypothetical protein [Candidatus Nanopelagicales bacterium]MCF8542116.1 hypothetical protein [Candidatus Nanopelagicales bacterium]MCF8556766.1 hypothetical protein [Candidatus Nanopelagicales bacterium]